MKQSINYFFAAILLSIIFFDTNGQTIIRDTLPYEIVNSINSANDSIIKNLEYPLWQNATNLLIENFALNIDTSWRTKQISDIVDKWKNEKNIEDDGESDYYYGLIKENNSYSIKKMKGTINYFFGEIGGGYKIEKTIVIQENSIDKILCLFDKNIRLDEKQINLQFIEPRQPIKFSHERIYREELLEKNVKFGIEFNKVNYDLFYTADLCLNGFQYEGLGTIYPTYYNLELKMVDKNSGTEQNLYRNSHSASYNISEIILGDIDNDSKPDIIYKVCDEMCIRRIIFLSSKRESNQLMKYIGQTEIHCWDP